MKKTAVVFTGLGSQCVGMGSTLCKEYQEARQVYEEAGDLLHMDLKRICSEGTIGELFRSDIAQLALFTTGIALYRVYLSTLDISPLFFAGHSMGEYTALVAAGIIKFEDALHILQFRSKLTKDIIDEGNAIMTIIDGISMEQVQSFCEECSDESQYAVVSCYNAPNQMALSGNKNVVEKVEQKIQKCIGASVTPIYKSAPFHSELMRPMAIKLREELEHYTFYEGQTIILSNVYGLPYRDKDETADLLSEQLCRPVQWMRIMDYMTAYNLDFVVEMSSLSVLSNLIKSYCQIDTYSFGQQETRKLLFQFIDRKSCSEKEDFMKVVTLCLGKATSIKNREHDKARYAEYVKKPYETLKALYMRNKQENYRSKKQDASQAITLLQAIMDGKRTDIEEQHRLLAYIIKASGTGNLFSGG